MYLLDGPGVRASIVILISAAIDMCGCFWGDRRKEMLEFGNEKKTI
jgi:hypothetical protein